MDKTDPTPATEAGRRLALLYPYDQKHTVDILAIEAEARAESGPPTADEVYAAGRTDALREAGERVRAEIAALRATGWYDDEMLTMVAVAVLAILTDPDR